MEQERGGKESGAEAEARAAAHILFQRHALSSLFFFYKQITSNVNTAE